MTVWYDSNFWKEKTLWKVNFWYQWIIQCSADSRCEYIAGGVNIYLYGCVSLLAPKYALWVCVCVCVFVSVWYQIRVTVWTKFEKNGGRQYSGGSSKI